MIILETSVKILMKTFKAKGGSHEISRMSKTDAYSGRENFITKQVEKHTAKTDGYSFYAYRKSLMSASVTRHS